MRRKIRRLLLAGFTLVLAWIALYAVVPVLTTPYMISERFALGALQYEWTPIEEISPELPLAVVAAEDANFCMHWGFDLNEIRAAIEGGGTRGASTISQQTVKNAYLWHGRSWFRKALETLMTPAVELIWSKRRVVEVYLNIAEFDEGVFGAQAAAQHYFGKSAKDLTPKEAARLAAVLPAPKERSASQPNEFVRKRTASIMDGAATIKADGRSACFED